MVQGHANVRVVKHELSSWFQRDLPRRNQLGVPFVETTIGNHLIIFECQAQRYGRRQAPRWTASLSLRGVTDRGLRGREFLRSGTRQEFR